MKKRIISIGILYHLSFVEEYAMTNDMEHINVFDVFDPDDVFNVVLSDRYDYIYIHLKQLDGTLENILLMFKKLVEAINSETKIIIGASEYLPKSDIIIKLRNLGITNFIFADTLFEQKDEFQSCMDGNTEGIEQAIPKNISIHDEPEAKPHVEARQYKTIAAISKTPRMGTSTLAIQIIKYLKFIGYKACYVEMNSSGWVTAHEEWLENTTQDENIGKITYQDIDMYYNPKYINAILDMDYDYYIYDYGTTENVSFFEKDIKIGVAGTSPLEMNDTEKLIEAYYNTDMFYCFNFVPETERADILDLMESKSNKTFFINSCPDPYFLSPENIKVYENVFNIIQNREAESSKPKKKRLFKR